MLHTINVEYWCLKRELWRKIFSLLWCRIRNDDICLHFSASMGARIMGGHVQWPCRMPRGVWVVWLPAGSCTAPRGKTPIWLYGKYFLFCQVRHARYPWGCLAKQWGLETERPCRGGSHSDLTKELPSNSSVDMSLTSQSLSMLGVCPSSHSRSSLAVPCALLSESFLLGGACDKLYDLFFIYVLIFWLLW